MTLVRILLALVIASAVSSNADAQTDDGIAIIRKTIESLEYSYEPSDLQADRSAKEIGLEGQWIVTSSEKDGEFSEAQIGQKPGDIISIGRMLSNNATDVQVT